MGYEIEVRTVAPQPTLSIRGACCPDDVAETLSDFLPTTFRYAVERGVQPAGPPFTRFFSSSKTVVEFEGGCPVPEPVEGNGRIVAGELPGGEVAVTIHMGPYDGLPEAAAALQAWATEHGREAAGPAWELYLNDPGEEVDPMRWQTEVRLPLV